MLEIQVDPSGYAAMFSGITNMLELVLDAAREATAETGVGIGVIVAANRTRHPLDAKTLARLARQYAGHGVCGFGLSNDERRGRARDFEGAFRIAKRGGLLSDPHGGELMGPESVRECLSMLGADRIGHGVRAAEDPALLDQVARAGVTLEVCPASNVSLGVAEEAGSVPVRRLVEGGAQIALGADDPLLFGSRLLRQYELCREVYGFSDSESAEIARMSVRGSAAPDDVRKTMLAGIDEWVG